MLTTRNDNLAPALQDVPKPDLKIHVILWQSWEQGSQMCGISSNTHTKTISEHTLISSRRLTYKGTVYFDFDFDLNLIIKPK